MIGKWLNYGLACLYIEYYASGVLQSFFFSYLGIACLR